MIAGCCTAIVAENIPPVADSIDSKSGIAHKFQENNPPVADATGSELGIAHKLQDISLDQDSNHEVEKDFIDSPTEQESSESDGCQSDGSPPSSPKSSYVLETKSLLNMYTSIESRVVADMKLQDRYIANLAEIKRDITRVERKLAHCRAKETLVLHRIQVLAQALAEKRNLQAEINVERVKSYQKRLRSEPRLVEDPENILTALSRPSTLTPKPLVA